MTERRVTARIKLVLPAVCWSRTRSDFYAVTDDVASDGIRFRSAVSPFVGEKLTCSIRHAGSLEIRVLRVENERFAARVVGARHPMRMVAQNLLKLAEAQSEGGPIRSAPPRIVPEARDVLVVMADGSLAPGRLVNVSLSGAALLLDEPPEVGSLITIGRTPAKVARRFDDGIGAAFLTPLPGGRVDARVVL